MRFSKDFFKKTNLLPLISRHLPLWSAGAIPQIIRALTNSLKLFQLLRFLGFLAQFLLFIVTLAQLILNRRREFRMGTVSSLALSFISLILLSTIFVVPVAVIPLCLAVYAIAAARALILSFWAITKIYHFRNSNPPLAKIYENHLQLYLLSTLTNTLLVIAGILLLVGFSASTFGTGPIVLMALAALFSIVEVVIRSLNKKVVTDDINCYSSALSENSYFNNELTFVPKAISELEKPASVQPASVQHASVQPASVQHATQFIAVIDSYLSQEEKELEPLLMEEDAHQKSPDTSTQILRELRGSLEAFEKASESHSEPLESLTQNIADLSARASRAPLAMHFWQSKRAVETILSSAVDTFHVNVEQQRL